MGYTQIKPLTEEEKKQKLEELKEKMTVKRTQRAIEEAKEAKANEAIRRKAGKVRNCYLNIIVILTKLNCLGHEQNQGRTGVERSAKAGRGQETRYVPHS